MSKLNVHIKIITIDKMKINKINQSKLRGIQKRKTTKFIIIFEVKLHQFASFKNSSSNFRINQEENDMDYYN